MRRTFDVDVLDCERCHRPMKRVGVTLNPGETRAALEHLGLPTSIPKPRPARAPPNALWN